MGAATLDFGPSSPPPPFLVGSSQVRSFRLAGTVTASHLMAGWVEVQKEMSADMAQTQFQSDAENKKKSLNKVSLREGRMLRGAGLCTLDRGHKSRVS